MSEEYKKKIMGLEIPTINIEDMPIHKAKFKDPMENSNLFGAMNDMHEERAREKVEDKIFKKELLASVKRIEENTATLDDIAYLLRGNSEIMQEIADILVDISDINRAETREQAEGMFKKVMGKITGAVENVESMEKLCSMARTAYKGYGQHKEFIDEIANTVMNSIT